MTYRTRLRIINVVTVAAFLTLTIWLLIRFNAMAQGGYEAEIQAQCAAKGCDASLAIAIMYCESGGDPDAWHANPYGGADVGLYQVNDATWGEAVAWGGPWVQIDWATTMIANGGQGHWWPSQHCWGG